MDHGVLNVPLSKRGDIDRQLDAYKAQQAAAAKREVKVRAQIVRELRERAAAVLAAMPPEQLSRIARRANLTEKQALKKLQGMAYFQPHLVVKLAA